MPPTSPPESPQQLAEKVAAILWSRDRAPALLGMQLLAVGPGSAKIAMPVRPDMTNAHHTCHGGIIFTLADTAFAYACNSDNRTTVAAAAHIDFLSPGQAGELLVAEAVEQARSGRSGIYDVSVRSADGRLVALFRGKARRSGGAIIEPPHDNNTGEQA